MTIGDVATAVLDARAETMSAVSVSKRRIALVEAAAIVSTRL